MLGDPFGFDPEGMGWGTPDNVYAMGTFDLADSSQATLNRDGSWTVYVSKQDPGLGNWIGTGGHQDGLVFCRWLLSKEFPEKPSASVTTIADLRAIA
jgi:hypothetical protein